MEKTLYIVASICFVLVGTSQLRAQYDEPYRPQYHFSPKKGWIGDPDGLVYHEGLYHLFWWGHAVSKDLVHWEELPYPLAGGPGDFSYFSGSVVVDKNNDSGFGDDSMIAFYTRHYPGDSIPETQAISISEDGIEFNYYQQNPVLDIGKIFFRDPQVFWHDETKKWIMAVSLPAEQTVQFYGSKNLTSWSFLSDFKNLGVQNSFWECPDLFKVPIEGENEAYRWVLLIGRGPNRVQYFVGDFDGEKFTVDQSTREYLQHGIGMSGKVLEDFEGKDLETEASPDRKGYLGKGYLLATKQEGDSMVWESGKFRISNPAINFLISGDNDVRSQSIQLIIEGQTRKIATGHGDGLFRWNGWDVSQYMGKEALVRVVNQSTDTDNALSVDQIMLSDQLHATNLEHGLWLDYGNDFYAARTWRDYDGNDKRKVMLGWMGNWEYANLVPSSWGKGFQSIPRTLKLRKTDIGYILAQEPLPQLDQLRSDIFELENVALDKALAIDEIESFNNTYEMEAIFTFSGHSTLELELQKGQDRSLPITYDSQTKTFVVDRNNTTNASNPEFLEKFESVMQAPVELNKNQLHLRIFVDRSSVEIFMENGAKVFSVLTYPGEKQNGIRLKSSGGKVMLTKLKAWKLSSIWTENK